MQQTATTTSPRLLTIKQFVESHPWCKLGGIRGQVFRAELNGMKEMGVVIRVGRKVLINEERYFAWVQSLNAE